MVGEFVSPNNGEELKIPLGRYEDNDLKEIFQNYANIWLTVLEKLHKHGIEEIDKKLHNIEFFLKDKGQGNINIFRLFIAENITYRDRLRFYGLYKYLLHKNDELDEEGFNHWMRIVRNIVEDTDNSAESFIRMVGYINDLAEKGVDKVYSTLEEWGKSEKESIPATIKHEIEKASLILATKPHFDLEIRTAENNDLCRGKIVFLLKMLQGDNNIEIFKQYVSITCGLFDKDNLNKNNYKVPYIILRALFASEWEPENCYLYGDPNNWRDNLLLRDDIIEPIKTIFEKLKNEAIDSYETVLENYTNTAPQIENPFFYNLIHCKFLLNSEKANSYLRLHSGLWLYVNRNICYRVEPTPIRLFERIKKGLEQNGFEPFPQEINYRECDAYEIAKSNIKRLELRREFKFNEFEFYFDISVHLDANQIDLNYVKSNIDNKEKPDVLTEDALEGLNNNDQYWGYKHINYDLNKKNFESLIINNENKSIEEFADEIIKEIEERVTKIKHNPS